MKIIIDTHVFLWTILEPHRLSATMKASLLDPANEFFMSVASVWEIGTKYSLGKLPLLVPPEQLVPQQLELQRIEVIPLTMRHALYAHRLPWHHRDPFDRMILAQAAVESLPVMTADVQFQLYPVKVLT